MTTVAATPSSDVVPAKTGWSLRLLLAAVGLALLGVAATFDVWSDLAFRATHDEEASHILLVPIIVVWLAWLRRKRAATASVCQRWIGPIVIAIGWVMHSIGDGNMMLSIWQLGGVVIVLGCLLTVLGTDLLRRFGPAVAVLIFLVPLPNRARQAVTMPMQRTAATTTQVILDTVGTGVERQGNLLSINGAEVTVAEACNGLRMTHALTLIAVAFAFATPLRPWVRLLVLALSPLFAVTCNVLRLVPTVWFYGAFDGETADMLHDLSGWAMLFLGYFVLTGFVWSLDWLGLPVYLPTGKRAAEALERGEAAYPRRLWPVALAVVLLAGIMSEQAYWGAKSVDSRAFHAHLAAAAERVPRSAGAWIGREVAVPTQAEELLEPVVMISRSYERFDTGRRVSLLVVHCADNRDLFGHYPPDCYGGRGWEMLSADRQQWDVDGLNIYGVRYQFRPPGLPAGMAPISIINFMLLPGVGTVADMDALEDGLKDRGRIHYGAGEFQLLFFQGEDEATQDELLAHFVALSRPLLDTMLAEPTGLARAEAAN